MGYLNKERILVIGACGQIGVELTLALRKIYGEGNVVASDLRDEHELLKGTGPYVSLDVMNKEMLHVLVIRHNITQVYHLAAILSATGEKNPGLAWHINMQSLLHVLDVAKEESLHKVYWPSSIAVFGPGSPKQHAPQHTIIEPTTVYGISKMAGERWLEYYHKRYGVDVRSVRYPGLISYKSAPGGGTTDYAVEIFHEALEEKRYTCFLSEDTHLPMMYMPDAIRATIELMEAPAEKITVRSAYNISAMSFSPGEISEAIRKHIPDLEVDYIPDYRQEISDTWPQTVDDSQARADWGWKPQYDLQRMTADMLVNLRPGFQLSGSGAA
ncbi:NAD-dependent epimerase/dehydratase family protein [Compostibacter hankyongensis]|uniref:NAD-dependent epimerase/dehydratase family protein n=1 Tax=Compostibacter hankyongensis TaxID=1007089 RepID=A0ABP8G6I9_9BACT